VNSFFEKVAVFIGSGGESAFSARSYVKSQPERRCGHSRFQPPTRSLMPQKLPPTYFKLWLPAANI
jgi:hypothetical protein